MRRFWSWVLACALLAAHTLGAVHGVAHARIGGGAPSASQSIAAPQSIAVAALAKLFKTHDDGSGCRLYDQLSHGDAVPAAVAATAPTPAADCAITATADVAASTSLPFRARGPPFLA